LVRSLFTLFALAASVTPMACDRSSSSSSGSSQPSSGPETVLTIADDGKSVTLARGATLTVKLAYQSGTGYTWSVAKNEGGALTSLGEPTTEAPSNAPGGGATRVFRFTASAPGHAKLDLTFARDPSAPAKTFHVDVTVQ
jgi:predicted secreted protein